MKFKIVKKVDLAFVGEGWADCYLEFRSPSYGEISVAGLTDIKETEKNPKEAIEKGMKFLEEVFASGKAISETGEKVDVMKEDLKNFPLEVINKCFEAITGVPPKNS